MTSHPWNEKANQEKETGHARESRPAGATLGELCCVLCAVLGQTQAARRSTLSFVLRCSVARASRKLASFSRHPARG